MGSQATQRQLDELGRIVIPKDIRKRANLNPRDFVNISYNKNIINLEKNNFNDKISKICDEIINHLYSTFKNNIIVTNKNIVLKIYGKDIKYLENKNISKHVFDMMSENNLSIARLKSVEIINKYFLKDQYYYIPVKEDNNIVGSIFIEDTFNSEQIVELIFKILNS